MKTRTFLPHKALGITLLTMTLLSSIIALGATTGTITLQGIVQKTVAITVTGSANYNALDLGTSSTNLQVASVVEQSNSSTGYKVTLSSANGGALKNGTLGSVSYTAQYNGTAVTLNTTPQTITNTTSSNSVVNLTKALTISFTGQNASSMMAGTYSDTLTFTIAAN